MASRVTSSRLVGRDVELIELESALASAAAEQASLVVVGGDSGIGKTRLVASLRDGAEAAGAVVMTGECLDLADAELPYAPIVGALRPLARERDPVFAELTSAERSELARLLPMVDATPAEDGDSGAAAQVRLFEALLALLDGLHRQDACAAGQVRRRRRGRARSARRRAHGRRPPRSRAKRSASRARSATAAPRCARSTLWASP